MIVCVGLATRDTIYAVPRHPGADDRVVATERVVAGGGPAATAAVAAAKLGCDVRFGDGTRSIITEEPERLSADAGVLPGADWVHVDHVGVDGGNAIEDLDLSRVALYAPTEATDEGRRAKLTVVTHGADGCTAYVDGERIDVPGHPVDAVSTLGAGDVFHGALVACLDRGLELREALQKANAAAALSCRALDGRSAIPTWEELP